MSLESIKFQYFSANVYDTSVLGKVSLSDFIRANKNPKPRVKEIFKQIEEATLAGDLKLKGKLKTENLVYFCPACMFQSRRRNDDIISINPILVLDFDGLDNAEEFKQFLFDSCSFIICCYLSPSKSGVKALVLLEDGIETIEEWKSYYYGLAYYMCKYKGFDSSSSSISLPLFLSYDENLLYRENPTTWTQKGKKINEFDYKSDVELTFEGERTEYEKNIVKKKIRTMIETIEDNAHPTVRSVSILCGGYCAFGYLTEQEAKELIYQLIDENSYTCQKANNYKKTVDKFLVDGMKRPLELELNN